MSTPTVTHPFLQDLLARGLLQDHTDLAALDAHLTSGQRSLYVGFDPTAPSLHIGNFQQVLVLKRAQLFGLKPIALVGGATGLIGDPGGRTSERTLNPAETVQEWTQKLRTQLERYLDFTGPTAAMMVNNFDWLGSLSTVNFLRDVGKHFSVNMMLNKEAVSSRLGRDGGGISYTEFSYMILQAYDFAHLCQHHHCTIQFGGSDQWGNITAGLDLIRRTLGAEVSAHCFSLPLLTKADGTKMGKSVGGAVWLDAQLTSPYQLYQFWLNAEDSMVETYLLRMTLLPLNEISHIMAEFAANPGARLAQKRLAQEVVTLVHGAAATTTAERISAAFFAGALETLSPAEMHDALAGAPQTALPPGPIALLDAVVTLGLAPSKTQARELITSGAITIGGEKRTDPAQTLTPADALDGRYLVLKKGKKTYHVGVWA